MSDSSGILQQLLGGRLVWLFRESGYWTAFGLLGNFMFGSRFFIQWIYSEKRGKVIVPPIFWHLSFWGSMICLVYSLHIDKLPVILAYVFLPLIYGRNLILLQRTQAEASERRDA
jgi:lipid-A-disaccharide synthase-like uncharacterized protein